MAQRVDSRLVLAKSLALKAGKLIVKLRKNKIEKQIKKDKSIVTIGDKQADVLLKTAIRKKFPDDGIVSEESAEVKGNSGFTWILDPVDGTTNYYRNISHYCVSIGILKNGKLFAGVINNPVKKDLFYAQKGKGSFQNGKKIIVSKHSELINSLIVLDRSHSKSSRIKAARFYAKLAPPVVTIRILGSTALDLCMLAAGKAEAVISIEDSRWDTAAGEIIVSEAGGNKYMLNKDVALYCNNSRIATILARQLR